MQRGLGASFHPPCPAGWEMLVWGKAERFVICLEYLHQPL